MIFFVIFLIELCALFFFSQLLTRSLSRIFFAITHSQQATIYLLSFLFLPGVVFHELAHLISAAILFVPVGEIEFIPKIQDNKAKLGSVSIGKTDPFRRTLIGVAPILAGLGLLIIIFYYVIGHSFFNVLPFPWNNIFLFYIVFEIGNTMFSSRKDLEGTLVLGILLLIFITTAFFLGIRIPTSFFSAVFTPKVVMFWQKTDLFFLLPLGIDMVICAVANSKKFLLARA